VTDVLSGEQLSDGELSYRQLSDEELTALALAADPDAPLPDDAVPFGEAPFGEAPFGEAPAGGGRGIGLLPSWYMAPVVRSARQRRYRIAVGALVVAFLTIDLFGLCATYGPLTFA
jgi:hypothetical protein